MAKRAPRAANHGTASVDATAETGAPGASAAHFVVFRIADEAFAFRLDAVGEILRMPNLAHMPLGPSQSSRFGQPSWRGTSRDRCTASAWLPRRAT